jgi:hypothetical protein
VTDDDFVAAMAVMSRSSDESTLFYVHPATYEKLRDAFEAHLQRQRRIKRQRQKRNARKRRMARRA